MGKIYLASRARTAPVKSKRSKPSTGKVSKAIKTYVKKATTAAADVRQFVTQSGSYASGGDSISNTPSYIQLVTFPSQGDQYYNREGDIITPLSVRIRGHLLAADSYNLFRFIIFQWMGDTNTVSPSNSTLFTQVQVTTFANATAVYSPFREETKGDYHIIYDSGVKKLMYASASYLQENGLQGFDITIPKKKLKKMKASTPGATSGVGTLFMCCMSDSGAIVHPQIQWISEMKYIS